jgi:hypothetical protein
MPSFFVVCAGLGPLAGPNPDFCRFSVLDHVLHSVADLCRLPLLLDVHLSEYVVAAAALRAISLM